MGGELRSLSPGDSSEGRGGPGQTLMKVEYMDPGMRESGR